MQNILLEFSKFVKQQEKQELLEELEQLLKRTAPSAEAHQLRMALEASEEEIMALKEELHFSGERNKVQVTEFEDAKVRFKKHLRSEQDMRKELEKQLEHFRGLVEKQEALPSLEIAHEALEQARYDRQRLDASERENAELAEQLAASEHKNADLRERLELWRRAAGSSSATESEVAVAKLSVERRLASRGRVLIL